MTATTEDLRAWLERRYHDYDIETEPKRGTYGLIWIFRRRVRDSYPESFAVKTIAPEALQIAKSAKDIEYLRREFRMWLGLPHNNNVLTALGFDVARLVGRDEDDLVCLPVMRMKNMSGSLADWISGEVKFGAKDRLIALAQTFNGLMFLYMNGMEGHGDLKPSNILYSDLRGAFAPPEKGWPSVQHPWLILLC